MVRGSVSVFVRKMGSDGDGVAIDVLVKVIFDGLWERGCVDRDVGTGIHGG